MQESRSLRQTLSGCWRALTRKLQGLSVPSAGIQSGMRRVLEGGVGVFILLTNNNEATFQSQKRDSAHG